jgi:EF hand
MREKSPACAKDQYRSGGVEWAPVFPSVVLFKEVEMKKHVLLLTTAAVIFVCGAIGADAQAPTAPATEHEMGYGMPVTRPIPGGSTMQQKLQDHAQSGEEEESDEDGRMMGMMGRGYGHRGCHRGHGVVGMRIIFSLMDADGDGTVSLQEFQAAQERIFRAMDADHDGTVTLEEMQDFMRGVSRPVRHQ